MVKMEKESRKSIGILTDVSKTFRITSKDETLQVKYDELPKEIKNKKQSFLDFLGGNFQEINTLARELSALGEVSIALYVNENLFISDDYRISPYELNHPETVRKPLNFDRWLNGKDVLIISLIMEKMREFISLYHTKITYIDKPCIISTGRSMINKLSNQFPGKFMFLQRKGVARFGKHNRHEILAALR